MATFDAVAARSRWASKRTDELDAILLTEGILMRGRRNKADCINCLVELEAFNFWKQCSLSRLQAILHEKQLTPPTTFTVDAYARALAQSDTAAGRVHTWNNRTVRELRAALIVNQIPYASNERKWNLINLLISANIEPPQLPGASMIVRTSQRPNEPNNSGVGGPLVESWVSMPPRSRASSRSALGASATMASVNTQHVAENHSRMSSPPVLALQRSPSLLSAGGRPIASALHSVPATALDLSVPEQTLERGPVPDRTARPSAQAGGDLQDALSTLRRAWDAMTAGQLERCRDQFYATLSAPKDDSNVNDGALTQHLQDLLPELDERIRDKYLKTSSVVSANVVNSPASGNITTTSSRPLQITYPPLSTSSPLHTRSDRHDDHVLDPRLASSTPPPLSPRRPIQPIGTPRPSGPLRPTPASMSTSSSTAIASHHHSPLRRPTLDDTLAFPNPREYLAALPTTPYDELLRRGQSLVPRSSLASGEEYENPPNPPSSVVSAIPGTWPLEGHLQAQDTAANRSPGSSADTSYPPLPAADEAFLQAPTPCPAESHHEPSSPVSVLRWQGSSTTSSDPNSASTLCITEEDVKDVGSLAASLVSQVDLPTIARRRSGTSKAAAQPLSISSQVDLRSVLERSFGRGSLTPSTPPPTLATSAIHSAATTSDGEKDNYSGVGANVPHCEDHNDPACTASDTLASPQPSSFDETLPADLGPASDSDSDEGPSAFEHDVSDGAQVEEDDSVLAAVSQIRTQEDKVTIQGLPRSIPPFGKEPMDITAEIVDMAHSLLAFHECRDRDKEDYNKFRRYVGRYAKNAKTIMQHICDMTPEPAILTSLENSDQARQHLRTFQERLNLVDN